MARDGGLACKDGGVDRPRAASFSSRGLARDAAVVGAVCAFLSRAVLSRADASDVLAVYSRLIPLDAPQHVRPVAESLAAFPTRYLTLGVSLTPSEVAQLGRALQRVQGDPLLLASFRVFQPA